MCGASLNYLVGERKQLGRNVEAERLGGLEVDDELEFGGLNHRQVDRLLAPEYPPSIDAGLPVGIGHAGRVAHYAAGRDELAHGIDRRNPISSRQLDKPLPVGGRERAATDEQRASPALHERCKGTLEVTLTLDLENDELLPDGLRRGLHFSALSLGVRTARIDEHANCRRFWDELAQHVQSLRPQLDGEKAHAGDIA